MKISLLICTRNNAAILKETLSSVVRNLRPDVECLVIDNASMDDTWQIVEEYQSEFKGAFRYLYESQPGLPHARNLGIKEAAGEIIAFTDDDCEIAEDYFDRLFEIFRDVPEDVGIVGGKIIPRWLSGRPRWLDDRFLGPLAMLDYGDEPFVIDYADPGHDERRFFGANFAFRRWVFDKYGLFDTSKTFAQDVEMFSRLLNAGGKAYYAPELVVYHKVPEKRLRPEYFYQWYYRRGVYKDDISEEYHIKKQHPFGVPLWLVVKAGRMRWQSVRSKSQSDRVFYRCLYREHLGRISHRLRGWCGDDQFYKKQPMEDKK